MEKSKLINLLILFLSALFFWISITIFLPALPPYLQDIGATTKQIGFVMGCFAIGLLFSRVHLGKLADEGLQKSLKSLNLHPILINSFMKLGRSLIGQLIHYPNRKIVILIGTFVAATAPIGYLLFTSIPELMVVRAFHGISIAAFTTGYSALVVDLSPPKQRGELIGYMSLAIPVGMAIGPIIGGVLQEYENYSFLFLVCFACGLMAFVFASFIRELDSAKKKVNMTSSQSFTSREVITKEQVTSRSFGELIVNRSFAIPTIVLSLIGCLFGALITFLPLYVRDMGFDFNVGLYYTAAAIASFLMRLVTGKASDQYGRGMFISGSIVCYIFSMLLLCNAQTNETLMLSANLEGMGAGVLVPITLALISDRCRATERAKAFAVCISGFDVGVALGGPIIGSFFFDFGYPFLFASTAVMGTIALFVFVFFSNKNVVNSLGFTFGKVTDLYALEEQ